MARPFMFTALCQRAHHLKHSLAESIFANRVRKTAKKFPLAEKFISRVTRQPRYHCTFLSGCKVSPYHHYVVIFKSSNLLQTRLKKLHIPRARPSNEMFLAIRIIMLQNYKLLNSTVCCTQNNLPEVIKCYHMHVLFVYTHLSCYEENQNQRHFSFQLLCLETQK